MVRRLARLGPSHTVSSMKVLVAGPPASSAGVLCRCPARPVTRCLVSAAATSTRLRPASLARGRDVLDRRQLQALLQVERPQVVIPRSPISQLASMRARSTLNSPLTIRLRVKGTRKATPWSMRRVEVDQDRALRRMRAGLDAARETPSGLLTFVALPRSDTWSRSHAQVARVNHPPIRDAAIGATFYTPKPPWVPVSDSVRLRKA